VLPCFFKIKGDSSRMWRLHTWADLISQLGLPLAGGERRGARATPPLLQIPLLSITLGWKANCGHPAAQGTQSLTVRGAREGLRTRAACHQLAGGKTRPSGCGRESPFSAQLVLSTQEANLAAVLEGSVIH